MQQQNPEPHWGYLFSYFAHGGTADGQQISFALSEGNDPLRWRELNGGRPVLTSTLGERGLRDPFVIRSPEGDRFHLIATDLLILDNGDWDAAQRTGSTSVMVWESADLVHWGDQQMAKIAPDTAGNTWAPEAHYDAALGAYVVFWASALYAEDDPEHRGDSYQRMLYATTRDFRTFSQAKVWLDPGHAVIDSTVIEHDGWIHRFTKDEREQGPAAPHAKFVAQDKARSVLAADYRPVAEGLGEGTVSHCEGPIVFKANRDERWYLFVDEFGGRGYLPFESTDLDSGVWTPCADYAMPGNPCHGSVLPLTRSEYDRLEALLTVDQ
jgi:hypothetical protein